MYRAALLDTLEAANRHVAEGQRHIERQRDIVTRLEQRARGTSQTAIIARQLLLSMERVQRAHLNHRDQIRAELARLDTIDGSPLSWSINSPTGAELGRDAHIEGQERS